MDNLHKCLADREPLEKMVKGLLMRESDFLGVNEMQYLAVGKDVYRDLNLYSIRWSKRVMIEVDRNTNSIRKPDDCLLVSSIVGIDDCGRQHPLFLNTKITGEVVDINLSKDCSCECGCHDELCGKLKNYEVVNKTVQVPAPEGGGTESFEVYSRKTIYPNGDYYLEYNEPVAIYENGVHTSTELQERKKFICKLETKACGCVKDTDQNRKVLSECCGADFVSIECNGCSAPVVGSNNYGVAEMERHIHFNSEFEYSHVLLRYYPDERGKDIMVPIVARRAIMYGIKAELIPFEPEMRYSYASQERRAGSFESKYEKEKKKLFRLLNRFDLDTFYKTVLPPRRMV
jgi:hypothetical protein